MIQWALTYISISLALFWLAYKMVLFFKPQKPSCACGSCSCGTKKALLKNIK